jgi:hypothetical protein
VKFGLATFFKVNGVSVVIQVNSGITCGCGSFAKGLIRARHSRAGGACYRLGVQLGLVFVLAVDGVLFEP